MASARSQRRKGGKKEKEACRGRPEGYQSEGCADFYRTIAAGRDTRGFPRVEERLEGFLFGLEVALTAILWISLILFSCSSFENCCKDAYIISAIFRAAFFCLASLLSVFIFQMLAMQVKPVLAALHIAYQLS